MPKTRRIVFLFVGGAHQALHTARLATHIGTLPNFEVTCLYLGEDTRDLLDRVATLDPGTSAEFVDIGLPNAFSAGLHRLGLARADKVLGPLLARAKLADAEFIITAERTTVGWRHLFPRRAKWIHFPHGAGDGAKGFEKRMSRFDAVFTIGEKDRQRIVAEGLQPASRVFVAGAIKISTIFALAPDRPKVFNNTNPTVLYNPHFNRKLGSWDKWGAEVIAGFRARPHLNLIVAPHVRLFEKASTQERRHWTEACNHPNILFDPGSTNSLDMTYTRAADVYLGDISSQVYEFIAIQRKCIFLEVRPSPGDDPSYEFQKFGKVVVDTAELAALLDGTLQPTDIEMRTQGTAKAIALDYQSDLPDFSRIATQVLAVLETI